INIVVAESFARIFRQNMYNCGMIAAELPREVLEEIFRDFADSPATVAVDTEKETLTFKSADKEKTVPFTLKGFEKALVEAGGWVEYAAAHY
ncbi:MAG: 3-isopropylmalate dehydratase small subunit, partial [Treponema sp.]|nr:3-isopropylmalate dehydratase small subunit [Treponema sp.]